MPAAFAAASASYRESALLLWVYSSPRAARCLLFRLGLLGCFLGLRLCLPLLRPMGPSARAAEAFVELAIEVAAAAAAPSAAAAFAAVAIAGSVAAAAAIAASAAVAEAVADTIAAAAAGIAAAGIAAAEPVAVLTEDPLVQMEYASPAA